MKKISISIGIASILLLCAVFSQGQDTAGIKFVTGTPFLTDSLKFSTLSLTGVYVYNKTGKLDTVKAVLLITDCDNCQSKSVPAFAVREQHTYFGNTPQSYYSDSWSIKSYLDINKKAFPPNVIVWDYRLISQCFLTYLFSQCIPSKLRSFP